MNRPKSVFRPLRLLGEYGSHISAFKPNARLYLFNVIITGAVMGVFRLLFNFYVLSLGFDEALLGNLITTSSFVALLAALPMGYLADTLGRKGALLISGALLSVSILAMSIWQTETMFYSMNILSGIAQSLAGVTMAPFLMENSDEKERTYLFSFGQGLQMTMASVGSWIGGYLPTWMGQAQGASPPAAWRMEIPFSSWASARASPSSRSYSSRPRNWSVVNAPFLPHFNTPPNNRSC